MIRRPATYVLTGAVTIAATLCAFAGPGPQGRMKSAKASSYASVSGLFKAKCISCHNTKSHPEMVDLTSYAALMKSGDHGPIVIAGPPEKSKLIMHIDGTKAPRMPMGKPPLGAAEIAALKAWVKAGAKP